MKFTRLLLAVPVLMLSNAVFAQTGNITQTHVDNSGSIGLIYSKRAESQPAIGTQYYIETFAPAKIDNANEINLVRFNAYNGELELQIHNEINVLQPKENQLITLVDGRATYQYLQYVNKDNVESQNYLLIISNHPNFKIFKKERIQLIPEQHPTGGYQTYKAPQYKKLNPEYYIQLGNGKIVYTDAKKKDLINAVPGKEKQIAKYMKDNKIKTSDEADLTRLGAYISSIM